MRCFKIFRLFAVCLLTQTSCFWASTQAQSSETKVRGRVTTGIFDSGSKQVVLATEKSLRILSVQDLLDNPLDAVDQKAKLSQVSFSQITSMDLSPDSKSLLIAGGDPGQRGSVECWDWPSERRRTLVEFNQDGTEDQELDDVVTDVRWLPSGKGWIESHWSGEVRVRDLDGRRVSRFAGHTGIVLSAIPWDEQIAISCGIDQTIKLWKISNGELIRSLDNHTAAVTDLLRWTSSSGQALLISIGRDRTLRLWDPLIGRLIRFVKFPSIPIAVALADTETLMVLQESGRVSRVSLPGLVVQGELAVQEGLVAEEGQNAQEPGKTIIIQIAPGIWRYW